MTPTARPAACGRTAPSSGSADSVARRLFAYDLATGERLDARDLALAAGNRSARGIWSDGETVWVLDFGKDSLFAYDGASGALLAEYALDPANDSPHGLYFDGVSFWVSDHDLQRLFAYRLPAGDPRARGDGEGELRRNRDEEFTQPILRRAGNHSPRGIWSDGGVMYVADRARGRVYAYNMPDAIDARLASLTLSGIAIGEFSSATREYEGVAGAGLTQTTVAAAAVQPQAQVAIDPRDADAAADGDQVALEGLEEIRVTVTSPNGSRVRTYRVALPAPVGWTHCLRGDVAEGFSLVVYEGGSVADLAACAAGRGVTALYVLHGGAWVSYSLGRPGDRERALRRVVRRRRAPVDAAGRQERRPAVQRPEPRRRRPACRRRSACAATSPRASASSSTRAAASPASRPAPSAGGSRPSTCCTAPAGSPTTSAPRRS